MSSDSLNRFPYEDRTLPTAQRVEDLLARMTLEDKAGLLFQPLAPLGSFDAPGLFGSPSVREILDKRINHLNILQAPSAREIAEWHNALQAEAQKTGLGIPVTISSDPRHSFSDNPATQLIAGPFSQWPEFLGFGGLNDPDLTRRFADTVRREYIAVGIRTALHPQVDLATEPRWARASGTFGESVDVVSRLGVAYVQGLQGETLGSTSVAAMAKHFPGGGPQLNGEDPHFPYGREQVYPGEQFDLHLEPFKHLIAAGVSQMMPYYGMPIDTEYEEVGFSFNKQIVTGLLREQLGFDGIVCSDWGILSNTFWGVESLSYSERLLKSFDAGIDQWGGEFQPEVLIELTKAGKVTADRLDESVRRVLREKFLLGLFENRKVDVEAAVATVGSAAAREEGVAAQAAAVTLLSNSAGPAHLPLAGQPKVYVERLDPEALAGWANVVLSPDDADVAIIRTVAPWEQRGVPGDVEFFFHAGSLDFHDDELAHIREIAAKVPTIVDVYLDRPAILASLVEVAAAITVNFGASADAYARVVFGAAAPKGTLPFDIPASMEAVLANRADVPFDTADATFRFGHGLRYEDWSPATRPDATSTTTERVVRDTRYDVANVTVGTLLDDPDARAVIDDLLPELPANPMIDIARGLPFDTMIAMAGEGVSPEIARTARERIAALPPVVASPTGTTTSPPAIAQSSALTASSSIGTWLDHPVGAPLINALLEQAGVGQEVLGAVRSLPLQQLVVMSQGQMPQEIVDSLVLQANDGVAPADDPETGGWKEKITDGRFAGKTVIVTGAASGIGRATASRIAREGGRVIAVDISADRLTNFRATLPTSEIVPVAGDITKQEDIDAIVTAAGDRIDALANVAGINDDFSPLHETTDAVWERVLAVNLTGGFKLSRAVIPRMLAVGAGAIVNVASEAGLRGNASGNAYTVSKHGVIGATRSAAFMYGPQGLRVNAVAPGGVATGIPMPANVSETGSARLAPFQNAIPSVATAEALAASITFLLSDDAVNINGVVLASDGGWSVQ